MGKHLSFTLSFNLSLNVCPPSDRVPAPQSGAGYSDEEKADVALRRICIARIEFLDPTAEKELFETGGEMAETGGDLLAGHTI